MTLIRIVLVCLATTLATTGAVVPLRGTQSDLDAFMARVVDRRDENWKKLRQYVLDEREEVSVVGPSGAPLWGQRRDYTWFIRDGVFVRSPVRVNGVVVADAERRQYEAEFVERARRREETAGEGGTAGGLADAPASAEALLTGARRPQFIDTAYFLRFTFEPGRYALVGREMFAGHEVLRVEYYPERLFAHELDDQERRRREGEVDLEDDLEASTEQMMNKVSLVTLWIEPEAHQIVRYTFDNVEIDFLPAAWLFRLTEARATMTMSQPFPDVWLPASIEMRAGAMLASGAIDVRYQLDYHNYREATTSGRMREPAGE